jgi:hypothetical protein
MEPFNPEAQMHCKKYDCWMPIKCCVVRQQNGEPACKNCEQGRQYFQGEADTYIEKRAKRAARPKVPCQNAIHGCENLCYEGLCNTCKSRMRQRKASGWDTKRLSLPSKINRFEKHDCKWPHGCRNQTSSDYCVNHRNLIWMRRHVLKWDEEKIFAQPGTTTRKSYPRAPKNIPCRVKTCPHFCSAQSKSKVCHKHIALVKNRIENGWEDPYAAPTPNDGSRSRLKNKTKRG